MILKNKYLIFLVLILTSCGSTKQTTSIVTYPEWVKSKPVNLSYYIGIGSAQKIMGKQDHLQQAKNKALADLSSEITTQISVQSALHQLETTMGYSEDYLVSTSAKSNELLEGYELVDSFEDATTYWIYYRLSKTKYQQIKETRKHKAMQIGLNFLTKARQAKSDKNYTDAINFYIQGLESVKNHLSETLDTTYNGEYLLLGNELLAGLTSTINSIRIVPQYSSLQVKQEQAISKDQLVFTVNTINGEQLTGIPIKFTLGNKPLRNNTLTSDLNGKVDYELTKVSSPSGEAYFVAEFNLLSLADNATNDSFLKQIIRKIEVPQGQIHIKLSELTFYIIDQETNLTIPLASPLIKNTIGSLLVKNNYRLSNTLESADYLITVNLNTTTKNSDGKMHYASLIGEVKVLNQSEETLLIISANNTQGVQLNDKDAGTDAYKAFNDIIERTFINKLTAVIK